MMSSAPTKAAMIESAPKRLRWGIGEDMPSACVEMVIQSSRPGLVVDTAMT